MRRFRLSDASVATLLEWIRLAAAFPGPRMIWSAFLASLWLQAFVAASSGSLLEDPATWGLPMHFFFTFLRLLAKRVGVLGMREPIPGAQ